MIGTDKKRTIAVTGATGLLGRHLCDYFSKKGWQVNALVRDVDKYPFSEKGINIFKCILPDIIEPESIASADVLIHCAYMTRFTNLADAVRVNEEGTVRLHEAARNAGVKKFVFVSSRAARQNAQSYYAKSKFKMESMMDQSRDLIIRPGLILSEDGGLFYRIAKMVQCLPVLPSFGGNKKIQTVHVDDLCEGFGLALENNLCGKLMVAEPDGITMSELMRLVSTKLDVRNIIIPLPITPFIVILRIFELLKIKLPVSSENLRGLVGLRRDSQSMIADKLGLRVRTAEESLADLAPLLKD